MPTHIARNRSKRLKTSVSKDNRLSLGPFDDSLLIVTFERNEKCLNQISRGLYNKAEDLLKEISRDLELISNDNKQKKLVKAMTLNTQAFLQQKLKNYEQAIKILDKASKIEQDGQLEPIEQARTYLNKCVILGLMGKHEQSLELARSALELMRVQQNVVSFQKYNRNRYRSYEIMIISFYNIAVELSHLCDYKQANKICKEGYSIAQKILGGQHRLTLLLKDIIKKNKISHSKDSKEHFIEPKERNIKSFSLKNPQNKTRTQSKKFNIIRDNKEIWVQEKKQKQLKKIYLYDHQSYASVGETGKQMKMIPKEQQHSYRQSLQRVKKLYKAQKQLGKLSMDETFVIQIDSKRKREKKMRTDQSRVDKSCRYDPFQQVDIKTITLEQKKLTETVRIQKSQQKIQGINSKKFQHSREGLTANLPPIQREKASHTQNSACQII